MSPTKPAEGRTFLWLALLLSSASFGAAAPQPQPDPGALTQVLTDTSNFWSQQFTQLGGHYKPPALEPFSAQISGICDQKQTMSGSFYCPGDQRLYVDTKLQQDIATRAQTSSVLAQDYVVAHLVAHHVQYLIGTTAAVEKARSTSTPKNANNTLVTMELQADCYAGLWLHSASQRGVLVVNAASLSSALAAIAAAAKAHAHSLPRGELIADPMDSGTAAQRARWVQRGFQSGNFEDCDSFGAAAKGEL